MARAFTSVFDSRLFCDRKIFIFRAEFLPVFNTRSQLTRSNGPVSPFLYPSTRVPSCPSAQYRTYSLLTEREGWTPHILIIIRYLPSLNIQDLTAETLEKTIIIIARGCKRFYFRRSLRANWHRACSCLRRACGSQHTRYSAWRAQGNDLVAVTLFVFSHA